ncbi:hypothetical protein BP00DRAFT_230189 [Aspergillus indologenus CBS 114.80]|uniref:Uncharacterized protein n=1 Tax=Aspergillus indologenus CBS 114.80 TaxID=1450541 RepID=A0A2V5HYK2_9EURO|nr:hypothetical protein BP00DRAFT_230189 [Aspergillus indologenus CBS 114.80]
MYLRSILYSAPQLRCGEGDELGSKPADVPPTREECVRACYRCLRAGLVCSLVASAAGETYCVRCRTHKRGPSGCTPSLVDKSLKDVVVALTRAVAAGEAKEVERLLYIYRDKCIRFKLRIFCPPWTPRLRPQHRLIFRCLGLAARALAAGRVLSAWVLAGVPPFAFWEGLGWGFVLRGWWRV